MVPASPAAARVLVVDDSASARGKLALAVAALGHETVEAEGGARALARLAAEPFDLVLLDILMPDVDGFDVLGAMRGDARLREIPVLVVSGLENEPGTVTEAIRLGAVDFLPKAFESVLLRARIGAALRRKRERDRELAELDAIDRLTEAAALLERTLVGAERLGLGEVVRREDPLGRFAAGFERMATRLHARERRLRRQLSTARALVLLVAAGVLFGLNVPLAKVAVTATGSPVALSLWVNAVTATLCLLASAARGAWPSWRGEHLRFALAWGLIGAALAEVLLFRAATYLPASTLSGIIVTKSFVVYVLIARLGHEPANARRLAGLLLGLAGVIVIVATRDVTTNAGPVLWTVLAFAVPLCFAAEDVLLATRRPSDLDLVTAIGLASLVAVLALAPLALFIGAPLSPSAMPPRIVALVLSIALVSSVATLLQARLLATFGAVFGSQTSYVTTLAGIVWAVLLLGETLAAGLWIALGLLLAGLLLVGPLGERDDGIGRGVFARRL